MSRHTFPIFSWMPIKNYVDLFLVIILVSYRLTLTTGARLQGGGGIQVGKVTRGGSPHLSCKHDGIKTRNYMDRWVTPPTRVTSIQLLPHKGKSVSPEAGSVIGWLWDIFCGKWEISCNVCSNRATTCTFWVSVNLEGSRDNKNCIRCISQNLNLIPIKTEIAKVGHVINSLLTRVNVRTQIHK